MAGVSVSDEDMQEVARMLGSGAHWIRQAERRLRALGYRSAGVRLTLRLTIAAMEGALVRIAREGKG